ncbi:DnaA N-terminal domain-containing protein [Cochlodiniinecator piscidefendens]|uniref:DnaA N-terminal domain-containing protein n=1 Tax=Cochlodiniinecator piscidefendens TaxID=2715756 RepID=UPI00140CA51B|nr:DnaA N-terminal domain-containing protein [Cochlodiniinecator piscidefendens]
MQTKLYTGVNAGSLKYDLLTAISVAGFYGTSTLQMTMARLTGLITARYNWKLDEFSVGQRDLAKMWNVNERTVKREIKRCVETKILICKRQGVRGRVGAYRLNLPEIYRLSQPHWDSVGPDFVERMTASDPRRKSPEHENVMKVDFGPRIEPPEPALNTEPTDDTPRGRWRAAQRRLRDLHPENYESWFKGVQFVSLENTTLSLKVKTKFSSRYIMTHLKNALVEAVEVEFGPEHKITMLHSDSPTIGMNPML